MAIDTKNTILPNEFLRCMSPQDRPKGVAGMTAEECQEKIEERGERELQKQIANYLRQLDIPFNCSRMDKKNTGTVGWSDFTFPFKGQFWAIEAKTETGRVSKEQVACMDAIKRQGGNAYVVRKLRDLKLLLENKPF